MGCAIYIIVLKIKVLLVVEHPTYDNKEEDEEEDYKPKKSRPNSYNSVDYACCKCRWRKRNVECKLRMCLSCCVDSGQKCNQRSHLAAKASKDTILFLEQEVNMGKKVKVPRPEHVNHIPPQHPDITAFLHGSTKSNPPHTHYAPSPSPPPVYVETINLSMFLASIHLQQYLPIFMNNGFDTMPAMATLNESLLDALGIRALGHRALLLSAVSQLRQQQPKRTL